MDKVDKEEAQQEYKIREARDKAEKMCEMHKLLQIAKRPIIYPHWRFRFLQGILGVLVIPALGFWWWKSMGLPFDYTVAEMVFGIWCGSMGMIISAVAGCDDAAHRRLDALARLVEEYIPKNTEE